MFFARFWAIAVLFGLFFMGGKAQAQTFRWENPYQKKDSLQRDSLLRNRLVRDFFQRDTLDFIKLRTPVLVEESVLAKNDRQRLLGDLKAKGSFVRGISFGNNQGSSVQSAMDLQLTGRLSKDVTLLASISDHNLPVQADGYTQTLAEFDKIYLQLNIKQNNILRAGHLDLAETESYFSRYQRRSMGLQFQTKFGQNHPTTLDISAGVARSEFNRVRFQGREGNQGPYRLTGQNGEGFITILSGSEQVYIDGILMRRGENLDYVINYNTGEITFTSFRPIFRQNFITVSYNYTNRNYNRYLFTGAVSHLRGSFRNVFNWFYEADNGNSPLALNLSETDKTVLAAAGSNPDLMYAESGQLTAYDPNKVLYKRVEQGASFYYEFSTDAAVPLYQVAFTNVGANLGDYRMARTDVNGRVFQYVGQNQGDYRALRKLPAPQRTQVYSYSGSYTLEKGRIGIDAAYSIFDANSFSSRDNDQNAGFAGRAYGEKVFAKNLWTGNVAAQYQHISRRFHILDRINDVEFARDFNLPSEFNARNQDRVSGSFLNRWANGSFANYRFNFLQEEAAYKGIKNDLDFLWVKKNLRITGAASVLKTTSEIEKTNFTRGGISAEYQSKIGVSAVGISMEKNSRELLPTENLEGRSFAWREAFVQHKIADSVRTKFLGKLYYRENDSVRVNSLENINKILGAVVESQLIRNANTTLNVQAHYRKFLKNSEALAGLNSDYIIGNVLFNQNLWKSGLRLQFFYELGNGQEAQREFQYLRVPDGKGVYKWTDYNSDGLQQLDEFEIAEFADLARYIRVYTNSVRYLPSNKNKLQFSLFLNPAQILMSENPLLRRINLNFSLNSQNSYLKNNRFWVVNPFERNDDQLLKNQTLLASGQFNATATSGWNGIYRYTDSDNILNANFSQEERRNRLHTLAVGYRFNPDMRLDGEANKGNILNKSQLLLNRNFSLSTWDVRPKFTYKLTGALQAEAAAAYRNRLHTDGLEKLQAYELTGTLQWERKKTSVRGTFSFIDNKFAGDSFSLIGNQMLDGLKPGANKVWTVFLQQSLNSFIMLNVNYEGRYSGERTIHIGSMQVKASF